eukprot:c13778_g1_i2.p1 GENE.c13778_g1_i2~~c13778_g1_i2.p1  ORF type:complete len:148 (+),score=76.09 c13778_g1_i2:22-444(+)
MKSTFQLPDGKILSIGDERFDSVELLFNSTLNGSDCNNSQELVNSSIMKCDIDLRKDLYEHILLSGGTTLIKNFPQRFEKEIQKLAPYRTKVKVHSPQDRLYSEWIGGCILASLPFFDKLSVSREDYAENGSSSLQTKFF